MLGCLYERNKDPAAGRMGTGFAMNQARDLGPRMAYQVLPIKNKADNNWKYGLLVPGIAPFIGAALAALFVHGFLGMF